MKNYHFHILTFFLFIHISYAQQKQSFKDNYGLQGEFTYKGELSDTLALKEGSFSLKWREIQDDTLTTFSINGSIQNHQPHGEWTWEQAGWDYNIEPGKSITPTFNLSGIQEVWKGNFVNSLPNGKWRYSNGPPILSNNPSRIPLRIEAFYKNGLLVKSFKIVDQSKDFPVIISGSCSENGVASGKWRFEYIKNGFPIIEERTYNSGILTHIIITSDNPSYQFEKIVDRNLEYLDLIRDTNHTKVSIGTIDFNEDEYDSYSSKLLSHYFNNHLHKEWQLEAFPYNQNGKNPIFKRFCFPINENERALRTTISNTSNEINHKIQEAFDLGNILINRKRSLELDLSISYLENAQKQIETLDSLLFDSYKEEFIYHDRANGDLKSLLKKINNYSLAFPLYYQAEPIELPQIQVKRDLYDFFTILNDFVNELNHEISKHIQILESNSIAIKKESEIRLLESKLENDWLILDSLYSYLEGTGEHIYSYWIKVYLNNKIQEYARLDEYEVAMSNGKSLLKQMDSLVNWYEKVITIDSFIYEIDDYYIQMAYNPYTGKYDISLPLKKRFVTIVKTAILPYMLEDLIVHEEWELFASNFLQLNDFKNQLIRFALLNEKQDSRIEKRLRREQNPEKFTRIFIDYMESR